MPNDHSFEGYVLIVLTAALIMFIIFKVFMPLIAAIDPLIK